VRCEKGILLVVKTVSQVHMLSDVRYPSSGEECEAGIMSNVRVPG
jgi:hypothetical protein